MKQSTNLELNEQFLGVNEELTHSQQQPQAPKTHKKESTVRLTTRITMLWAHQRSLLYRLKDSIEVKCKVSHSATNSQLKNSPETVNLSENASKALSKAPCCCCFENAPNIALTIVLIINVSIDYNWFEVPNLPRKKNILK